MVFLNVLLLYYDVINVVKFIKTLLKINTDQFQLECSYIIVSPQEVDLIHKPINVKGCFPCRISYLPKTVETRKTT